MAGLEDLTNHIYHEKQESGSMLCAQHALNSLLRVSQSQNQCPVPLLLTAPRRKLRSLSLRHTLRAMYLIDETPNSSCPLICLPSHSPWIPSNSVSTKDALDRRAQTWMILVCFVVFFPYDYVNMGGRILLYSSIRKCAQCLGPKVMLQRLRLRLCRPMFSP